MCLSYHSSKKLELLIQDDQTACSNLTRFVLSVEVCNDCFISNQDTDLNDFNTTTDFGFGLIFLGAMTALVVIRLLSRKQQSI
jgi:hypothetical protein